MDKQSANERDEGKDVNETPTMQEWIDQEAADPRTNPHFGEDPGLLESHEDPRERRMKRNTM